MWKCRRWKPCGAACEATPGAASVNTTNLWTHLRLHHHADYVSLKKFACLPEDQPPSLAASLSDAVPNVAIRPKLTPMQRDHANRLAAEFIVEDGEALSKGESKRLRAWVGYVSGQSYVPPCDDTVDGHVQLIADDGKQDSKQFNKELATDGIKPSSTADLWSDSGVSLYGAATHGIRRSCLVGAEPKVSWEMVERLAAASDFSECHHTGDAIRAMTDTSMTSVGIPDPVHGIFWNTSDGAANMVAAWHDRPNKRCVVHQIELSVLHYCGVPQIHSTLSQARGIVGHFNHSIHGKADLKKYQAECGLQPHNLTQDVCTRWRSTHDMCDDLRECQQPILIYDIRECQQPILIYDIHLDI